MIPHIKAHLPIVTIVVISALMTFSLLWMRDIVRIIEPTTQAAVLSANPAIRDHAVESVLRLSESADPKIIEADLRDTELHTIGEGLSEMQTLLGDQ